MQTELPSRRRRICFEFALQKEDITPFYGVPLSDTSIPRRIKAFWTRGREGRRVPERWSDDGIVSYDRCVSFRAFCGTPIRTLSRRKYRFADKISFATTHPQPTYTTYFFDVFSNPEYWIRWFLKSVIAVQKAARSLAPAELFATRTEICSPHARLQPPLLMKTARLADQSRQAQPGNRPPEAEWILKFPFGRQQNGMFSLILAIRQPT